MCVSVGRAHANARGIKKKRKAEGQSSSKEALLYRQPGHYKITLTPSAAER